MNANVPDQLSDDLFMWGVEASNWAMALEH